MKKIGGFFLFIFFIMPFWFLSAYGDMSNNKFGIHVVQPSDEDLRQVADLVNSSGGNWGYITLVIQENDRDRVKWQELFDKLRRLHLIPIIRLATSPLGDSWRRPEAQDADDWVDFLDSLNWVIKDRYIILFNEPNHGREWGGAVDALHYAETAYVFAQKLKNKNPDFFVMLSGFDAAAPSKPPLYEDEVVFLKKTLDFKLLTFNLINGWVSHSYPNHGFVGTPYDTGRNSVRTYEWELSLLKQLGFGKNLPVFITETGWPHILSQKSKVKSQKSQSLYYSAEKVAEYIKVAYEKVWLTDSQIMAVTPFIFNYQSKPFDNFSWKLPEGDGFYPQYEVVQKMPKIRAMPAQKIALNLDVDFLPRELLINSTYDFKLDLKNSGQAIIDRNDGYQLLASIQPKGLNYWFSDFTDLEPFESQTIDFYIKTSDKKGAFKIKIQLVKDKKLQILSVAEAKTNNLFSWDFNLLGLPSLRFKVKLFPKTETNTSDIELQIFDDGSRLVFRKKHLKARENTGIIEVVNNVVLNKKYRLVVLKPYYLPRQNFLVFGKNQNFIDFEPLLPVDFNHDGKLSFGDFWTLVKNPALFKLWWVK